MPPGAARRQGVLGRVASLDRRGNEAARRGWAALIQFIVPKPLRDRKAITLLVLRLILIALDRSDANNDLLEKAARYALSAWVSALVDCSRPAFSEGTRKPNSVAHKDLHCCRAAFVSVCYAVSYVWRTPEPRFVVGVLLLSLALDFILVHALENLLIDNLQQKLRILPG